MLMFTVMSVSEVYSNMEQPLLTDPRYYNLSEKDAIKWMRDESYTGTAPTVVTLIMGAFAFDVIGRRWTLAFSFVLSGLVLWGFVAVAPSKILFLLMSGLF